jgi:hypothetical protein
MSLLQVVRKVIPETVVDTSLVRLFGWIKVPLIGYVRPKVLEVNPACMRMMIPLRRRSRNHLNSMYMGALMIGADVASGYYAAKLIYEKGYKIDFLFRTASARFLKRPEGDVVFTCTQGREIEELVEKAQLSGERVEALLTILATVPSLSEDVVAEMEMVLSLKRRK